MIWSTRGKTLELVRRLYPKAHFATVYAKPSGQPMVDTFITEVSQDTWIFFPWDMALQYVQPYARQGLIPPDVHIGPNILGGRGWKPPLRPAAKERCP